MQTSHLRSNYNEGNSAGQRLKVHTNLNSDTSDETKGCLEMNHAATVEHILGFIRPSPIIIAFCDLGKREEQSTSRLLLYGVFYSGL